MVAFRPVVGEAMRFLVVGTIAFAVDAFALWLLMGWGVDAYLARALAFLPAFAANFALNRRWTFAGSDQGWAGQMARYFGVQATGMAINYAVYAGVVAMIGTARVQALAALAIGSITAMAFNFVGAKLFAFRRRD